MSEWISEVQMQDVHRWKRLLRKVVEKKILDDIYTGDAAGKARAERIRKGYVNGFGNPCHNLQQNEPMRSTLGDATFFDWEVVPVTPALSGHWRVVYPNSFSNAEFGNEIGKIANYNYQSFKCSTLYNLNGLWVHFKEVNLWGRVWNSSNYNHTLDYPVLDHRGNYAKIERGHHIDFWREYNYGQEEIARDGVANRLAPLYRVLTPRLFGDPKSRLWYDSHQSFPSPIYGVRSAPRPAVPGMRAIQYPDWASGEFGRYQQNGLNVHVFDGKRWRPMQEVHGRGVFPDVLDTESRDPNFKAEQPHQNFQFVERQNYFGFWTYKDIEAHAEGPADPIL